MVPEVKDWVFSLSFPGYSLSKNVVVSHADLGYTVIHGAVDGTEHFDNVYWNADGSNVSLGTPYGIGEIEANPQFVDFENGNYRLNTDSPYLEWGAYDEPWITPLRPIVSLRNLSYHPSRNYRTQKGVELLHSIKGMRNMGVYDLRGRMLRHFVGEPNF